MIMWGRHTSAEIASVIKDSLKEIAETTTLGRRPWNNHRIFAVTTRITASFQLKNGQNSSLNKGISDDAFERHVSFKHKKRNQFFQLVPSFLFSKFLS